MQFRYDGFEEQLPCGCLRRHLVVALGQKCMDITAIVRVKDSCAEHSVKDLLAHPIVSPLPGKGFVLDYCIEFPVKQDGLERAFLFLDRE